MACPLGLRLLLRRLVFLAAATAVPAGCDYPKPFKFGSQLPGRSTRLALQTLDLNSSLDFYRQVLGMRILRHEEHQVPCPTTCNGPYNTSWSRTVLGYEPENTNYAIELVHNYGVVRNEVGESLRAIALRPMVPLVTAIDRAEELGYTITPDGGFELLQDIGFTVAAMRYKIVVYGNESVLIKGPDNYTFLLLPDAPGVRDTNEPIDHIRLRVRDLRASIDWYVRMLGMGEHTEAAIQQGLFPKECARNIRAIGYSPPGGGNRSGVPLVLEQIFDDEIPVRVTPWDGRQHLTLPYHTLRIAYTWIHHYAPWSLVHALQYAPKEQNSTLLSAVIHDPEGNEITIAGAEVYDSEVLAAMNFAEPDWYLREIKALQTALPASPPQEPLCQTYKCPFSFPEPRPPLPPWHSWPEHPTEWKFRT